MNSQSALLVQGIHGSPQVLFMAARALIMMGSDAEDEEIFWVRALSMAQMWKYWSFPFRRVISWLSSLVSISSFWDRASAGPMLILRLFKVAEVLWSVMTVTRCSVLVR